jgi:hypothetical protein
MDPNSFSFMSVANQPPGYYTPTPGGMTTIYHHQAGDLHTPMLGSNLITPISIPNGLSGDLSVDPHADIHLHGFPNQFISQQFQTLNPFTQQVSYAPSAFVHRDSGYDAMDPSEDDSSMDPRKAQVTRPLHVMTPTAAFTEHMDVSSMADGEK